MLRKCLFLFCAMALLAGCKKYPDGPWLSLYTKKHRVVGEWDVVYFGVNGVDSTSFLMGQPFYGTYGFFKEEESGGKYGFTISDESGANAVGYWAFAEDKEVLRIHLDELYGIGNVGPYRAMDQEWDIQRLKEKELWLKCNYNNKEYFVKFKLIKNR